MKYVSSLATVSLALSVIALQPSSGRAASAAEISRNAKAALNSLYSSNPAARVVGKKAKAVLVFPQIIKGGFMVGAQHGDGALIANGRTVGYYNTVAASYGFQARFAEIQLRNVLHERWGVGVSEQEWRLGGWLSS